MTDMTDDFFLGYVELHSQTERALFSREHIKRFHELAGEPVPDVPAFAAMHSGYVKPRIAKARERLKSQGAAHEE